MSLDGATAIVTGGTLGSPTSDYRTVAYDRSTGARRWVAIYDRPAHLEDRAQSLAVSPDGTTVFVTGASTGSTGDSYATVTYRV